MSDSKQEPKVETPAETPVETAKSGELDEKDLDQAAGGGWPNVYVYTGGSQSGPI